jgi:DNA-binding GntR family transcriptional regulator
MRAAGIGADQPDPLWIQAVDLIRSDIDSAALKPGMRLPPERELCQRLSISRVTLRKALNQLVEDGILYSEHGRGWYVAERAAKGDWPKTLESFTETAARMGLLASSTVLRAELLPANLDEAEELGIAPGTPLFHLERVRMLGGVPIAVDTTHIAGKLVPDITSWDFASDSFYQALAASDVEPHRAESTIQAREADARTAELLSLPEGKPVLVMRQLAVDVGERPLFVSLIVYAGERYRLRTSFARSTGQPRS